MRPHSGHAVIVLVALWGIFVLSSLAITWLIVAALWKYVTS